ncbi:MAG: sulfatase-like hydrolase/transferase [Rikenellaceae bacterium]
MKKSLLLAALASPAVIPATLLAEESKPNILFLFADDHAFDRFGVASPDDKIITPNLDRLVNEGTYFTHAFNQGAWNGAVSVASRAMMVTGVNVWKAADATKNSNRTLWPRKMKEAGYDTYFAGKWHVNGVDVATQFDTVRNVRGGMANQHKDCYGRKFDPANPDKWTSWDTTYGGQFSGGKHWAEVTKDDAVTYLQMAKGGKDPFFMYIAFNSPHDPRQAPKEYYDMYKTEDIAVPESFLPEYPYHVEMGCPKGLRDERLAPFPRTELSIQQNRHEYYAMITHMDEQIGKILEELERSGKADNTYIIYTADHGLGIGDHGLLGKQNMYDQSMRAPFIIVGPNVPKGKRIDDMIYIQDAMATALDIAGYEGKQDIDFKSLMPHINGEKKNTARRDAVYGGYTAQQRSVRDEEFQLIIYPKANVVRLYNIKKDPHALNDLADNKKYAKKMKELYAKFTQLQKEANDKVDCSETFNAAISKL